jgi:hypothetical protein
MTTSIVRSSSESVSVATTPAVAVTPQYENGDFVTPRERVSESKVLYMTTWMPSPHARNAVRTCARRSNVHEFLPELSRRSADGIEPISDGGHE